MKGFLLAFFSSVNGLAYGCGNFRELVVSLVAELILARPTDRNWVSRNTISLNRNGCGWWCSFASDTIASWVSFIRSTSIRTTLTNYSAYTVSGVDADVSGPGARESNGSLGIYPISASNGDMPTALCFAVL
jgi:hypothetical protein